MNERIPDEVTVGPDGNILATYNLDSDRDMPVDGKLHSFTIGTVALSSQDDWSVYLSFGLVPFGHDDCAHDCPEASISIAVHSGLAQALADALETVLDQMPDLPSPKQHPRPEAR